MDAYELLILRSTRSLFNSPKFPNDVNASLRVATFCTAMQPSSFFALELSYSIFLLTIQDVHTTAVSLMPTLFFSVAPSGAVHIHDLLTCLAKFDEDVSLEATPQFVSDSCSSRSGYTTKVQPY